MPDLSQVRAHKSNESCKSKIRKQLSRQRYIFFLNYNIENHKSMTSKDVITKNHEAILRHLQNRNLADKMC